MRNAILVESIQGLQDIKMMQAESRFLHQWNSYIAITAESGVKTRRLTHGLVSWGMSVQNLLYATVVVVGAPLVINGDITTGAMVAASMLSTRMGGADDRAVRRTRSLAAGENGEGQPR
ncbi:type I secretion protein [Klebsiella michiganensis]|uniref:Type I secretion protein n=1 Tax=Klebsiella michiganensis TaxID=1134687 RepID=A0A7H4N2D9_9ENTR|nr:type I secretion protein [Klebsiella michiganensis]